MVVPYKEVPDLNGLTEEELADLWKLVRRCTNALTAVMKPDGFNIGINLGKVAGAGIAEHLHIHVVPRWNGDTNFMPVIANTGVVPEALGNWRRNCGRNLGNNFQPRMKHGITGLPKKTLPDNEAMSATEVIEPIKGLPAKNGRRWPNLSWSTTIRGLPSHSSKAWLMPRPDALRTWKRF